MTVISYLTDDPVIARDLQWLVTNDPVFREKIPDLNAMDRPKSQDGMAGLLKIIVGQQVSVAAAQSMWTKFTDHFDPTIPEPLIHASDDLLRTCGLSRQKITYIRGLAQAVIEGAVDIPSWPNKPSDQVMAEITALKGFGTWSAHMFLIFNLMRADVWPYGDLGIQIGLQYYLGDDTRPTEKETQAKGELFKGRETAAALLLWELKSGGI